MRPPSSISRIVSRLLAVAAAILICVLLASHPRSNEEQFEYKVIPPSCVDNGYTLITNKANGSTYADFIVPAVGHNYGDWQDDETSFLLTRKTRTCHFQGRFPMGSGILRQGQKTRSFTFGRKCVILQKVNTPRRNPYEL